MNAIDRQRLTEIRTQADALLDAPASVNPTVRNIDVLEAVLGDIGRVLHGGNPTELTDLIKKAKEAGE